MAYARFRETLSRWVGGRSLALLIAGSAALVGCHPDCDEATDKIADCQAEIDAATKQTGSTDSIGFSDTCDEEDRCVAGCINLADCGALAAVISGAADVPNASVSKSTRALSSCLNSCENQPSEEDEP